MAKASKATVLARIDEILRLRLDGAEFWDICEYVQEKAKDPQSVWHSEKPFSSSQVYRYIKKTDQKIAESCKASRGKLLRKHLAQRRNLYAKSIIAGDVRTALSVLADEARLLQLYTERTPAKKSEVPRAGRDGLLDILLEQLAEVRGSTLPLNAKTSMVISISEAIQRIMEGKRTDFDSGHTGPIVIEVPVLSPTALPETVPGEGLDI